MLRSFFVIDKKTRRINDIEPSNDIQEFASRVFEAFMESQKLENGVDDKVDKKETFFKTEFNKISKLKNISISEDLKSTIYNDLTSQTEDNYNRINLRGSASGVNVKTARDYKDEGKYKKNNMLIRLLVYDLGFKSKKAPQYSSMPEISLSSWWFTKSPSSLLKNHLTKINPYCDPDEEKIKRVLEEYEKYKEQDSKTVDSSSKLDKELALKQAIDEALKTDISATEVLDSKFNEIVGFLDRLPKAELNALSFTQPSIPSEAEGDFQNEGEPQHQPIPVEGKKHDKVAEFKEFLKTKNLICNSDNLQKVFALHELYQTYEAYLEKSDEEIEREIRITKEDLGAFKNEIGELIFKMGYIPQSSMQRSKESQFKLSTEEESQFKLSTEELEKILTFLNKNQKSEKKDNFRTLNPPLDIRKEEQIIVKTVERLKELKKNAITGKLESWYSMDNKTDDKTLKEFKDATYQAYEAYANASEQDTLVLKAIVLSKLNYGDHQDVSKNLKALGFLKILDHAINERYDDSIASYQKRAKEKAKQEEPNEIIKSIIEIPNTILKAIEFFRTGYSRNKEGDPTKRQ